MRPSCLPLVIAAISATAVIVAARVTPGSTQAGQAATFKAGTNLVPVDAIVQDRRGNFVLGLTADDFVVYEDGVRQPIEQVFVVMRDAVTGDVSTTGTVSRRVFVLIFDEADLETSAMQRIRKGAETFLNAHFRSGDIGGVVVDGQFYRGRLTTDRIQLLAGIHALRPAFDSREMRLRPFRDFPRIPGEAEAVRIVSGDSHLVRDLVEDNCREDAAACALAGGRDRVENKLQQKARFYVSQARDASRHTLDALRMATDAVAQLPGRKTLVFFSDGFFIEESRGDLRQIGGMAARVGATIYGVDGRGLIAGRRALPDVVSADRPLDGTSDISADGPEMLADATGGIVVRRMDDVGKALDIIARDTSSYYVIAYRPTRSALDGSYRRIEVTTQSEEITVRARRGYVATPLPPPIVK